MRGTWRRPPKPSNGGLVAAAPPSSLAPAPRPQAVFDEIHAAGGVASLAHPGLYQHDEWIGGFVESGLDAIEAYHSRHDSGTTAMYLQLADRLGLLVTGGSDYHGDPSHGPASPGSVSLPQPAFDRLAAYASRRATSRASASGSLTSS